MDPQAQPPVTFFAMVDDPIEARYSRVNFTAWQTVKMT